MKRKSSLVKDDKDKIEIEDIKWTCRRCMGPIIGFTKLVTHNEECTSLGSPCSCPVCNEVSEDDTALKNHILDIHLQPELLNVKQEPDSDESLDEDENDEIISNDDVYKTEGNKKKLCRKRSVRKSSRNPSLINRTYVEDDLDSFGTHFLDGYGTLFSQTYLLT